MVVPRVLVLMVIETPPGRRTERSTLERARTGDELAFRELTAPFVRELQLHCYRMLGSLVDAEDVVQDTLFAAWRALDGFAGRASVRTWLYRIATNRCLNAIRSTGRRPPIEPLPPFDPPEPSARAEVTWLQPYPDAWLERAADSAPGPAARYQARETVELAFIAAVQRLPARQNAALLLCDVLGFSTAEVGAMLDTSPTAVKGLLQRARAALNQPGVATGRAAVPEPGSPLEQDLARRFAKAFTADDIAGVIALLTDDARLAMPPAAHEYHGPDAIAAFLRASARWRGQRHFRLVPTRANTQPAFGCYLTDADGPTASATGIVVLTLADYRITTVTRFLNSDLMRCFGLGDTLDRSLD
jgi:RNA polymerase sigma-70 factor (TIGR02960 family)